MISVESDEVVICQSPTIQLDIQVVETNPSTT